MLPRPSRLAALEAGLARSPVVAVLGPRQCGKTTLARQLVPAVRLQRFWAMLAHVHGQLWNGAELGRSLGVNQTTCRRYLDLLTGPFMVRLLQPWHVNSLKRQVKAPKIYFRDTGLLHQLLQIPSHDALLQHPPDWGPPGRVS